MIIYTADEIRRRLDTALNMFDSEISNMRRRLDDNNHLGVSLSFSLWKERINVLQFIAEKWEEQVRFEREADRAAAEAAEDESPF